MNAICSLLSKLVFINKTIIFMTFFSNREYWLCGVVLLLGPFYVFLATLEWRFIGTGYLYQLTTMGTDSFGFFILTPVLVSLAGLLYLTAKLTGRKALLPSGLCVIIAGALGSLFTLFAALWSGLYSA